MLVAPPALMFVLVRSLMVLKSRSTLASVLKDSRATSTRFRAISSSTMAWYRSSTPRFIASMGRPAMDPLQSAMIRTGQRGSGLLANSRSTNSSSGIRSSSPTGTSSGKTSSVPSLIRLPLLHKREWSTFLQRHLVAGHQDSASDDGCPDYEDSATPEQPVPHIHEHTQHQNRPDDTKNCELHSFSPPFGHCYPVTVPPRLADRSILENARCMAA